MAIVNEPAEEAANKIVADGGAWYREKDHEGSSTWLGVTVFGDGTVLLSARTGGGATVDVTAHVDVESAREFALEIIHATRRKEKADGD